MSLPQPIFDIQPSERLRSLRKKRKHRLHRAVQRARFQALGWELTGRLAVNLTLTLISLSTLVRLIPYYQTQLEVLDQLETSLAIAQTHHQALMTEFTHYFDPTQMSHMIQDIGARQSEEFIPLILVDPLPQPANSEPTTPIE